MSDTTFRDVVDYLLDPDNAIQATMLTELIGEATMDSTEDDTHDEIRMKTLPEAKEWRIYEDGDE